MVTVLPAARMHNLPSRQEAFFACSPEGKSSLSPEAHFYPLAETKTRTRPRKSFLPAGRRSAVNVILMGAAFAFLIMQNLHVILLITADLTSLTYLDFNMIKLPLQPPPDAVGIKLGGATLRGMNTDAALAPAQDLNE